MKTLVCKTCGKEKPCEAFRVRKRFTDGTIQYRQMCLKCASLYDKKKYTESDRGKAAAERVRQRLAERSATTKTCTKCNEEKSVSNFSPDKVRGIRRPRCKECHAKHMREYNRRNSKSVKASKKKSYTKICRFEHALKQSADAAIRGRYRPCSATVDELREAFTGRCHVCGVPELELTRKLCVDHCHETGLFRGHLCGRCNSVLGMLEDSQDLLVALGTYLDKTKQGVSI